MTDIMPNDVFVKDEEAQIRAELWIVKRQLEEIHRTLNELESSSDASTLDSAALHTALISLNMRVSEMDVKVREISDKEKTRTKFRKKRAKELALLGVRGVLTSGGIITIIIFLVERITNG